MDPMSLVTGAVSTLGSILLGEYGSTKVNSDNMAITNMTNQANLDLYREQYRDQIAMWEMTNRYNTPAAQMQRLREAGLNPALGMTGSTNTGIAQAATVPHANPMVTGAPMVQDFRASDLAQIVGLATNSIKDLIESQGIATNNQFIRAQKDAEIKKLLVDVDNALEDKKTKPIERAYLMAQKNYLLDQHGFLLDSFNDQKEGVALNNQLVRSQIRANEAQSELFAVQQAYTKSCTQLNITENSYKASMLKATISELMSRAALQKSTAGLTTVSTLTEVARKKGLELSNQQAELIMPFIREEMKQQVDNLKETNEHLRDINSNPLSSFGGVFGGIPSYMKLAK